MIKIRHFVLLIITCAYSCSPKINTTLSANGRKPLTSNEEVVILTVDQQVPEDAILTGRTKIGDSGFSTDCGYNRVIAEVKAQARKTGANIVKLTEVKEPSYASTCYQIKADLFYHSNPIAVQEKIIEEPISNTTFPENADYAVLYVYRPKIFNGAAIGYNLYLGDSLLCRVKNNTRYELKINKTGKQTLWASTESKDEVEIDIQPGKEYYLRCSVRFGIMVGRPELLVIDNKQGRKEYAEVKGRKTGW